MKFTISRLLPTDFLKIGPVGLTGRQTTDANPMAVGHLSDSFEIMKDIFGILKFWKIY